MVFANGLLPRPEGASDAGPESAAVEVGGPDGAGAKPGVGGTLPLPVPPPPPRVAEGVGGGGGG